MAAKRPAKKPATPSTPSATKRGTSRPATRRRAARPAVDAATDQLPAADLIDEVRPGGETHQTAGDGQSRLTTQQGVPVADDQNTLRVGERGPRCWRTSTSARRSSTSTTSGSPSGSSTPAASAPTASSSPTSRWPTSRGPTCSSARRAHAGVRALLDGRRQQGLVRPRPRRARLRREVLHAGGQLGSRRQQHPGVLHPGRDQVPRPRPRREAGTRPRLPAGAVGARQLLGLHLADARGDPHGDVDDVRPGDPALVPVHGGLRRPHVPVRQRRRRVDVREVPLEAEARPAVGGVERGGEDQRRRPRLPPPRPVGRDHQR